MKMRVYFFYKHGQEKLLLYQKQKEGCEQGKMLDHDVGGLSKSDALFLHFDVSLFRL